MELTGPASRRALLRIYLNDHLAATAGAIGLADRSLSSNPAGALGEVLRGIAEDLRDDRRALQRLLTDLGLRENRLKQVGVTVGERVGRGKLNGQLSGYSDLSRVFELEGLLAISTLQERVWGALQHAGGDDPRVAALAPLDRAERWARRRAELAEHHAAATERAFEGQLR
jgi:hypothetical protein